MTIVAPMIARGESAVVESSWNFPGNSPMVEIPLERAGPFLLLPIAVNGKSVGRALLDTGTRGLVLDTPVVDDLALKPAATAGVRAFNTTSSMQLCPVHTLQMGPMTLEHTFALNAKLSEFARMMGVERLAGIVGIGALPGRFTIDYRAGTLTLYKEKVVDAPAGTWLSLRLTRGMPEARVTLRGETWNWFQLDSGLEVDMSWTYSFAVQHHEYLDRVPGQPSLRADTHGVDVYLRYQFSPIEVFGTRISPICLEAAPEASQSLSDEGAGTLGISTLRRFHLYFDLPEQRIMAQPYKDASLAEWDSRTFDSGVGDLAGVTPLMRAAADGLLDRMPAFMGTKGANLEQTDRRGHRTALMYAAEHGQVAAIDLLLKAGAKIDQKDDRGNTALIWSLLNGSEAAAQQILKSSPDVQNANSQGETALILAAQMESNALVNELLRRGASTAGARDWVSAIHYAALRGNKEMVQALLRAKAEVDPHGKGGMTPLMLASQEGHVEVVAQLLDAGADMNAKSTTGDRPLAYAAACGDLATVRLLLNRGAKIDSVNLTGETALDAAVSKGHTEILPLLYDWKPPAP
jgi:ankyrin repeat protein